MPTERAKFLGIDFDRLSFSAVMGRLANVTGQSPFRYLVFQSISGAAIWSGI